MYKNIVKRILDVIIAFIGLIVLLPVFFLVGVSICIFDIDYPFFYQMRPGRNGELFKIIKFKTMNGEIDKFGVLLPSNERITKVGRIIRKYSLDEIPQLLNVLKGDMSLIGPRPLLPEYLALYNEIQNRRHEVRPGLTGWAQINGRNSLSWGQKFDFDIYYVDNLSFKLDMRILIKTINNTILAKDINAGNNITMVKFNGKN